MAMSSLSSHIDLSVFTVHNFFSKLLLVMIGLVMTVILQSSSAAITTTITALASQIIGYWSKYWNCGYGSLGSDWCE
ncbi:hypothetical protein [Acinetobacter sp. LoGeW2-3]|uniref:hypothetical protein n=1 Tax=Acinetobacter sp. LoGeW2-3 TaxID=1808001 RepID=UPI001D18513F|nr:hypothetical protein [Acinetobacter sp. LoGeW2-3]